MQLEVFNTLGKLISTETVVINSGNNELNVFTKGLAAGKFVVRLSGSQAQVSSYAAVIK